MRVVRLITFSYGGCNIIVTIVKIGMIVIINIDIRDKLVIIIPLGVIVILNTTVEVIEITQEIDIIN
jgi:hypothetical protein